VAQLSDASHFHRAAKKILILAWLASAPILGDALIRRARRIEV